ncbi:cyclic di-GMP phosphodiesterase response regulator RpfG [mine drainage metagenome]|uniref:Cyclic di-GMP phosphodiesterase response regulator RpfG n=1 Tax=mine drainage metagenome TaxID=410659 RepID=A0A1J5R4C3_9ZZZZ
MTTDDLFKDSVVCQLMKRDGISKSTIRTLFDRFRRLQNSAPTRERRRNPEWQLDGISHALLRAIAYRDPYSTEHMETVARLAVLLANKLGLDQDTVGVISVGAQLHDIGKIGIPLEVLIKPSQLSTEEMSLVRGHARIGWEIVNQFRGVCPAIKDIVLFHHERLDGSGYPFGHKSEAIPFGARLVGVADVIESMATHRPYRPALGLVPAIDEIMRHRGSLYDPEIVDVAIATADEIAALLASPT